MEAAELNLIEIAQCLNDEEEAIRFFESVRWPNDPVCPHCNHDKAYSIKANPKRRVRPGLRKCAKCRKQFTVRVGTIFEDSHLPLGKWLMAIHLMCSSKKGISALQLKRNLKVAYKTAWFMCHRIRYAMYQEPMASLLGAAGGTVEVDETYVGGKPRKGDKKKSKSRRGTDKAPDMVLVEREDNLRAHPIERVGVKTLKGEIHKHVDPSAIVNTDAFTS